MFPIIQLNIGIVMKKLKVVTDQYYSKYSKLETELALTPCTERLLKQFSQRLQNSIRNDWFCTEECHIPKKQSISTHYMFYGSLRR